MTRRRLTALALALCAALPFLLVGDAPVRAQSPAEVEGMIREAAPGYGLDPERMVRVAWCESGWRWWAVGDRGAAVGVFQFHRALWSATPQGRAGASREDAEANVHAALWAWSHGYSSHWSCQGWRW